MRSRRASPSHPPRSPTAPPSLFKRALTRNSFVRVRLYDLRVFPLSWSIIVLAICLNSACRDKPDPAEEPSSLAPAAAATSARSSQLQPEEGPYSGLADSGEIKQALRTVEQALDRGAFDEAAAHLLRMRMGGSKFSQNDGAAYRTALSESYSKALEAATKGDQRGRAAVQMIRAAGP